MQVVPSQCPGIGRTQPCPTNQHAIYVGAVEYTPIPTNDIMPGLLLGHMPGQSTFGLVWKYVIWHQPLPYLIWICSRGLESTGQNGYYRASRALADQVNLLLIFTLISQIEEETKFQTSLITMWFFSSIHDYVRYPLSRSFVLRLPEPSWLNYSQVCIQPHPHLGRANWWA